MDRYIPENIQRVIFKLSGEILAGRKGFGFDDEVVDSITDDIIDLKKLGVSVGIVLGGGNIFRGGSMTKLDLDRTVLDNIGMLATIQNALYLAEIINKKNYSAEVFSAISADKVAKFYTPDRVDNSMREGRICFLCGGTGNPFFTTDTAAVLRAIELNAGLVLKGTKVDGVYSADPMKFPDAVKYDTLSYDEALSKELRIMDMTAFSLAKEYALPMKVFDVTKKGNVRKALLEQSTGTIIYK
ncbi:MAG: UMP kinase [Candidatus Cloacimonetes bacterium]|nr:UMP kinase [Candidatus Cloacimonadota bacterium]